MARKPFILRASTADPNVRVINNLPGRYPTEDWHAYYWDVNAAGELRDRHCIIQLPLGSGAPLSQVVIAEPGIVLKVRRWGVTISSQLFETVEDRSAVPVLALMAFDRVTLGPVERRQLRHDVRCGQVVVVG